MSNFKGWEIIIVLALLLLLFGAKRLPDAARGLGRSLRIFKAETKGLRDDDEPGHVSDPPARTAPRELPSGTRDGEPASAPRAAEHTTER
jgi:sec-independent protein translocase protein TatA